MAAVTM